MSEIPLIAVRVDQLEDEEAESIRTAQQNPACFQGIYERWAAPVYKYFRFRTTDTPSAEDLTSQLFLAAYQALPRYRHQGHFAAWLFTIARNLAKEYFRTHQREVELDLVERAASTSDLLAEVANADEILYLRGLILQLSDDDQDLIRLRYVAELSFADMAIVLHRREDAVKKSLYRLQARLQSLMEHEHD